MTNPNWQTHRFRDCVGVYIGTGETVYLEVKQARALAAGLQHAARSIERVPFTQSGGTTRTGQGLDPNASLPTMARDSEGAAAGYIRGDS